MRLLGSVQLPGPSQVLVCPSRRSCCSVTPLISAALRAHIHRSCSLPLSLFSKESGSKWYQNIFLLCWHKNEFPPFISPHLKLPSLKLETNCFTKKLLGANPKCITDITFMNKTLILCTFCFVNLIRIHNLWYLLFSCGNWVGWCVWACIFFSERLCD